MDYQTLYIPNLFSLLLLIFTVWRIWKKSKTSHSTSNLLPGPWKLPLIGNMHQLVGSLPHHRVTDLAKKYGPLMHLQLGEVSNIFISSAEIAREAMKNHDINFAQRPRLLAASIISYNCRDIVCAPYGDYWRQLRKICTVELLSAKRVQSFRSIREEEVSNAIRSIYATAGLPINFSKMLHCLTHDVVARVAFGQRCKDRDAFISITKKILVLGGGFNLADMFPSIKLFEELNGMRSKLERLHQEADKILTDIIDERRARRAMGKTAEGEAEDFLHVLLNLHDHGELESPLATDTVKAVIMDIFMAGTEPSSATAVWAMSEMMRNPRVLEKAQIEVRQVFDRKGNVDETGLQELEYLKLVVKETLRLHPPALLVPRECRESFKFKGYDIPVGSKIMLNTWAIGRDPKSWNEPESFYPERFLGSSIDYMGANFELIPFGSGRRMCPGISFGIADVELPLAQLLYHFNWKLPNGIENKDVDMTETYAVTVQKKNDLYLIPIPYNNHPIS